MPPPYPPGSYAALVVADGASHYWRLDETSGTLAHDVIGGADGTISGGVTLNQPGAVTDPPPTTARSNKARAGAARSGYLLPEVAPPKIPAISIGGVLTGAGASRRVLIDSLTIHDQLNEVPNTCTCTVQGTRPLEGAEVIIAYGTTANTTRLFAGTILRVTQIYVAQRPTNVLWQVEAIDYTWELNRRIILAKYTAQSASAIAADLVATWAPAGFTTAIEAGLPVLDEISFTNTPLMDAFAQLATRIGGYAACDYHKAIALWITPTGTPPQDLTPAHGSLQEFQVTRDLSQVVTRALVEGGGVTAIARVPPGETRLPVDDPAWYSSGGGLVACGAQRIAYGDVVAGGTGAFVGPGVAPSSAPLVPAAAGAGLPTGTYKYAYTWRTAAGETLPSPLATATPGNVPTPTAAPTGDPAPSGGGALVANGTYRVKYCYALDAAFPPANVTLGSPSVSLKADATGGLRVVVPYTSHPAVTRIYVLRTVNNGSTYYFDTSVTNVPGAPGGFSQTSSLSDAALSARPAEPSSNTAAVNSVTVTGIAVGPSGTTARNVYRTAVNGAALKLVTTLANNTATALGAPDTTADAALGAAPPASDTSGLTPTSGIVLAGAPTLPVSSVGPFGTTGWARVADQVVRYTGASSAALTGIPATGPGAITASLNYGREILVAPQLIGIPASGAGAIRYDILPGDPVNLLVIVDDAAAQAALAALLGGDGVVEEYLQDNRITRAEAQARALALLELKGPILETYHYRSRDPLTRSGTTITVTLPAPINVAGTYAIQDVTISGFLGTEEYPFYDAVASSRRFTFEDLLRRRRAAVIGQG